MSLFLRQLGGEFRKLFARKRTYIGFGVFTLLEITVVLLFNLPKVQMSIRRTIDDAGYDSINYLSGVTVAIMIVLFAILLLEALFLALVGGDIISKEVEDGSLRMMLCRPISRGRIFWLKVIVTFVYSAILTTFIMLTALGAGLLERGTGGVFVVDPFENVFALYQFAEGLSRYLMAIPLVILSMSTIAMIALFLSCFNMKPSAATVITLSYLFADTILKGIPYFESIRSWFITPKMACWIHIFDYRVPWEMMTENYAWLVAIDATLLVIGWLIFERRDFK